MANINPNKLSHNFSIRTGQVNALELFFDAPIELGTDELVVVRRKDAFPVELRNAPYDDRYTDVAQVELYRAATIYCSHLITGGDQITIAGDNNFYPTAVLEFERDSKLTGRLIRDSRGQVFRIVTNTSDSLTWENIATNPNKQVQPEEGPFIILPDFTKTVTSQATYPLLSNANTIEVLTNSFIAGDKVTIRVSTDLTFAVEWTNGATPEATARNIADAIIASGIKYVVTVYGNVVLVEKGSENTLSVTTNTASLQVTNYAAATGRLFVANNTFTKNQLTNLVFQDSNNDYYFIKSNEGRLIELYEIDVIGDTQFTVLSNFNNTYPAGYLDTYRNYAEALIRQGAGLEPETYYYYTIFTTPKLSENIVSNEIVLGQEIPAKYTVDKLDNYISRVFYEDIIFANDISRSFTYNTITGDILYSDTVDLSSFGILIGDLFADDLGQRFAITDNSFVTSGIITISPAQPVSLDQRTRLHGSITRANPPLGLVSVLPEDVFKDLAGNNFKIVGTPASPIIGLTIPPAHAIDVEQGLLDISIFRNDFLIPYSYDPANGIIQYGEEVVSLNSLLTAFSYNGLNGELTYAGPMDLNSVSIGDYVIDSSGVKFQIRQVIPASNKLVLDLSLSINNTVVDNRDGSIINLVGFKDIENNYLIDLTTVQEFDLLKTNSKAVLNITSANHTLGQLQIDSGISNINTLVVTQYDGSVLRRGAEIAFVGYDNEFAEVLIALGQGGIRRYDSIHNSVYANFSSNLSTQAVALNAQDRQYGELLYGLWPEFFRLTDTTDDLSDLMQVFGKTINEMFSTINTLETNNAELIIPNYLGNASTSTGLSLVSENLGIDTRRRIMRDLITAYKLKGSRDGIAKFIKIITTWDITNGTGDLIEAIIDDTPELVGLRFYSPGLGELNTNFADTAQLKSPPAGRFYKGVKGLSLPGFFQYKEVIIELPNVALEVGTSSNIAQSLGNSTLQDTSANFGGTNNLAGCFIIANEGRPNDFYQIVSNTPTSVTVVGSIPLENIGAKYVILSPLNLSRFIVISDLVTKFMPFNTKPVFNFTIKTV